MGYENLQKDCYCTITEQLLLFGEEEEEGRKSYALSLVQRGRWHGAEKEEWGTRGEPRDDI